MGTNTTTFCQYTQDQALSIFPHLLRPHLPYSNALYNRLQCPQNTPDRRCLFASTFLPSSPPPTNYTILFADRSRRLESQVWVFNPLVTKSPLSPDEECLIQELIKTILLFIKSVESPGALGWPFNPTLKFASIHEYLALPLIEIAKKREAVVYGTMWNHWIISLSALLATPSCHEGRQKREGLERLQVSRVPEEKLELVIANSSIPRQRATLKGLANAALLDETGEMVAWAFIGVDGSLCTLHVVPEWRGKGLAKWVARELLVRYADGSYGDLGVGGERGSGWVYAEVGEGNAGSEGVMRALGGKKRWMTGYIGVDLDKF